MEDLVDFAVVLRCERMVVYMGEGAGYPAVICENGELVGDLCENVN